MCQPWQTSKDLLSRQTTTWANHPLRNDNRWKKQEGHFPLGPMWWQREAKWLSPESQGWHRNPGQDLRAASSSSGPKVHLTIRFCRIRNPIIQKWQLCSWQCKPTVKIQLEFLMQAQRTELTCSRVYNEVCNLLWEEARAKKWTGN